MPTPRKGARAARQIEQEKPHRRLVFEVPLPPTELSPNVGGEWNSHTKRAVIAARRAYREVVAMYAAAARDVEGWGIVPRVRVSLEVQTRRRKPGLDGLYRPRDVPNAISACKALFDGLKLADWKLDARGRQLGGPGAGLFPDDDHLHMELGRVHIDVLHGPGIVVTVEAIE